MLEEARRFDQRVAASPLRLGAAAALTSLPPWERAADFPFRSGGLLG
jgi:hypothetical protein